MSFSSCIPLYLLLRNVNQLPSSLRSIPDFRQALVKYHSQFIEIAVLMHEFLLMNSFYYFTLSSLTYRLYAHFVSRLLRQLQTLSFVSLQFFELEVKLLLRKKRPFRVLIAWQRPTLAERKSDYHR